MFYQVIAYFFIITYFIPTTIKAADFSQLSESTSLTPARKQEIRAYVTAQMDTHDFKEVLKVVQRYSRRSTQQTSPMPTHPASHQHNDNEFDAKQSDSAQIYASTKETIRQKLIAEHTLLKPDIESEQALKNAYAELLTILFDPNYTKIFDHNIHITDEQITAMRTAYNKKNFFMRWWNGSRHITALKKDLQTIILPSVYKSTINHLTDAQESVGKRFITILLETRLHEIQQPEPQPSLTTKVFSAASAIKNSLRNFFGSGAGKASTVLAIAGAALYFMSQKDAPENAFFNKIKTIWHKIPIGFVQPQEINQ